MGNSLLRIIFSCIAYIIWSPSNFEPSNSYHCIFFLIGFGLYYLLIPKLAKSDSLKHQVFAYVGVSLMMIAAMMWIFEADIRAVEFSLIINVSLLVIQDAYGEGKTVE